MTPHPQQLTFDRKEFIDFLEWVGVTGEIVTTINGEESITLFGDMGNTFTFDVCISHSSAQSGQSIRQDERDKVLDKLITFRMTTNVKIEDETLGNYYTSLDAWKDFELLLEELRSKQKQP